ncbi:hypothetical protein [Bacillus pumilus]|uniref:hypothetical protein n=1 Tax=Bacillus pumilus TaxID=1408 RepID=UPI000F747CDD|nr:hypothetical protein [Bacillus pumilus]TYS44677.1 hypothetical protein FZC68_01655 [Bacillus pumilus]
MEARERIRFARTIEELLGTISVRKKIEIDGKESILKVDFEVQFPEERDGETYVDVFYQGFELQE